MLLSSVRKHLQAITIFFTNMAYFIKGSKKKVTNQAKENNKNYKP